MKPVVATASNVHENAHLDFTWGLWMEGLRSMMLENYTTVFNLWYSMKYH